jgi:hypothetical protein
MCHLSVTHGILDEDDYRAGVFGVAFWYKQVL